MGSSSIDSPFPVDRDGILRGPSLSRFFHRMGFKW